MGALERSAPKWPQVSVVTPFFNTAPYLEECIASVLAQTYSNFEYILVDNQSTDSSAELAARFAASDHRIRIVRTPRFLSQVENYNFALRQLSGAVRFVKIVEADNWIFPSCLEKMVALAEANPSVGLVSAFNATERAVRFTGLSRSISVLPGRQAARMHLQGHAYLFGAPTTVLMRADLVRRCPAFYDESALVAEDLFACYKILQEADFAFVHDLLTFVRTDNESILSSRRDFDAGMLDRLAVLKRYGLVFLTSDEYERTLRRVRRAYYQRLAVALLRGASPKYWEFHRTALASLGENISTYTLIFAVFRELLWLAVNPGQTVLDLIRGRLLR